MMDRRDFGLAVAGLAVGGLADTAAGQSAVPDLATANALTDIVKARWGQHLNEEQTVKLRLSLQRSLAAAGRMAAFKLQNGDEPAFVFSAEVPA